MPSSNLDMHVHIFVVLTPYSTSSHQIYKLLHLEVRLPFDILIIIDMLKYFIKQLCMCVNVLGSGAGAVI